VFAFEGFSLFGAFSRNPNLNLDNVDSQFVVTRNKFNVGERLMHNIQLIAPFKIMAKADLA